MKVYVVYRPYDDNIEGVYSDKGEAYKKVYELSQQRNDSDFKVSENETDHSKKVK